MRIKQQLMFGFVLTAALMAALPVAAQQLDELRQRVAVLEAQLAERDAQIAVLEAKLAAYEGAEADIAARQAQLDQRESDLEVMAGAVTTGELADRFDLNVRVRDDADGNKRVVSAGPVVFTEESLVGDFFASAVYGVPLDQPEAKPEKVALFLQGKFSGGQFERLDAMTFDVAGETLTLTIADYELQRKRSGLAGKNRARKGDETVRFDIDVPTLRRLSEATSLSVSTPQGPIQWGREHRALLRALVARIDAAGAAVNAD